MNSNNDLLHQSHSIQQKLTNSFKLLKIRTIFTVILFIALIAGMGGYLLGIRNKQSIPPSQSLPSQQATMITKTSATITQPSNAQPTSFPTTSLTSSSDIYTGWKIFTSKTEGFTIHYPNNWAIEDHSLINCGHKTGMVTPNGYCRDSFDFISPGGLFLRYVIHKDENDDKIECGVQSPCIPDNVDEIETLNVSNLGEVLLVKSGKTIMLHKPINSSTMPIIGTNEHSNYNIDFSLPSKTEGRFILLLSVASNSEFNKLTNKQYYNNNSVKQAILVLKSLKY